jgi:hypothetical protein
VAWGSVFGLVIGYALSRMRHANFSADLLLFEYITRGLFSMGRQEGVFS